MTYLLHSQVSLAAFDRKVDLLAESHRIFAFEWMAVVWNSAGAHRYVANSVVWPQMVTSDCAPEDEAFAEYDDEAAETDCLDAVHRDVLLSGKAFRLLSLFRKDGAFFGLLVHLS